MSKKDEIRKQREMQKKRTRILVVAGIVVFAILIVLAVTLPQLKANSVPIGNIQSPISVTRPIVNGLTMGDPKAPILVEVYSDFQCPFCKKFAAEVEPGIVKDFVATGKVYYKYIPYKVIGPESDAAASAAYCAGDQNKFWEYHDILFANQTGEEVGDFTDKRLLAFAEKIGLDTTSFKACYNSNKYINQLQLDMNEGIKVKVDGTPSIYVNHTKVTPDKVYNAIAELLVPQ
jgi:protein-disulfide isomerase